LPPQDSGLVPLAGAAAGLLDRPAEALAEEAADVVGVVANVEVPADEFGDAGGGPEAVRPAVGLSPAGEQDFQAAELAAAQVRRPVRVGPGGQGGVPAAGGRR